jgi:hypothetical protein
MVFGVLALQVKELRHHQVGDLIVDRGAEEDDALVEQPRVDVELALAAGGALDDHGDQWHEPTLAPAPTAPPSSHARCHL